MRYIVVTAKHHDGFCMFDAPGTDYKITKTPFGRDICLELSKACAKMDMRLGFYYSPPDMNHPGYRDTSKPIRKNWLGEPGRPSWSSYLDYMESHIRALLTDYGDVCMIWFDGLCNHAKYDTPRFHRLIRELSPSTLINDRLGGGYDFITPEQFIPKKGIPVRTGKPPAGNGPESEKFFRTIVSMFKIPIVKGIVRRQMAKYADGTMELTPIAVESYPSPERFQPWETCMTLGRSWAYNPNETAWKSPGELVRNLATVAGGGGTYLLNVGPMASGAFPAQALERLAHIGTWMDTYADSIRGTVYTPFRRLQWGSATRKGDKLFLHVFEWPAGGSLEIPNFPGSARGAKIFGGGALECVLPGTAGAGGTLTIRVPSEAPDKDVSVIVVDIDSSEPGWSAYGPAPAAVPAGASGGKASI
jgi:alpha-L-fucosidase